MTLNPEKMPLKMRCAAQREDFKIRLMNSKPWHWAFAWAVIALVVASPWIYSFVTKPGQEVVGTPVPRWLILTGAAVAPLGAIFTTLGVGVAMFVALRDSRRFSREEERRHQEDTERRADQARLIQVSIEWGEDNPSEEKKARVVIMATNYSSSPILDVWPDTDRFKDVLHFKRSIMKPLEQVQILAPTEGWTWVFDVDPSAESADLDPGLWHDDPDIFDDFDRMLHLGITFTDAKGVKWRRNEVGGPQLVQSQIRNL